MVCAKAVHAWDKFFPVVYVAADRWGGIEYAMEVLGEENVGYLPGPKDRNSCSAVLNSFLEILLLAGTSDAFVSHGGSTFAKFITMYGELVPVLPGCVASRPGVGVPGVHIAVHLKDIMPK